MLALIWAQARDDSGRPVIGAAGGIPWDIPEDRAHFRKHTIGHPVVMGPGTWESLGRRPLKGRANILCGIEQEPCEPKWELPIQLVRVTDSTGESACLAYSTEMALDLAAHAEGGEQTWVIGGGEIYRQIIDRADQLVVTEIDLTVDGDTFAPDVDPDSWAEVETSEWQTSSNGPRYRFKKYQTKRGPARRDTAPE